MAAQSNVSDQGRTWGYPWKHYKHPTIGLVMVLDTCVFLSFCPSQLGGGGRTDLGHSGREMESIEVRGSHGRYWDWHPSKQTTCPPCLCRYRFPCRRRTGRPPLSPMERTFSSSSRLPMGRPCMHHVGTGLLLGPHGNPI